MHGRTYVYKTLYQLRGHVALSVRRIDGRVCMMDKQDVEKYILTQNDIKLALVWRG